MSTDAVVHELYREPDVVEAVVDRFGEDVAAGGIVDRGALARTAFATESDRQWLEALLWPRVGERIVAWRSELERSAAPSRAAVVEVPLLFESGMDQVFDATIAVIAEESLRSERAGARGYQALAERSARQLTQKEKAQRATYVVVNDGTADELEHELATILGKLST